MEHSFFGFIVEMSVSLNNRTCYLRDFTVTLNTRNCYSTSLRRIFKAVGQ